MGKTIADSVLDAALNKIGAATIMNANSAEPTTKTQADTTFKLATTTPTFTGPANGDVSGRKITSDAKNGVTVDTTGVANHVSLTDATELLQVTTVSTPPTLNAGGQVNFGAWDSEIADPT